MLTHTIVEWILFQIAMVYQGYPTKRALSAMHKHTICARLLVSEECMSQLLPYHSGLLHWKRDGQAVSPAIGK